MALTDRQQQAFVHPVRAAVLTVLADGPASPDDIARVTGHRLGSVAYHVRVLADLRLLELHEEQRVRGAVKHIYRLRDRAMIAAVVRERAAALTALRDALEARRG